MISFSTIDARSRRVIAFGLLAATTAVLALACGGDNEATTSGEPGGRLVTSTPANAVTAAASGTPTVALVSPTTSTPLSQQTGPGSGSIAGEEVALFDLAPCGNETDSAVEVFEGGLPVLAYSGAPKGSPILFPFESGELRLVDAREGAITLVYDIEDVGVLSIHAAGSSTLERTASDVQAGTVIGHFADSFGEDEPAAFGGYQLLVTVGTEELVQVGGLLYAGEPLIPVITDCFVLP